jgi:uncharacterized membrane protein
MFSSYDFFNPKSVHGVSRAFTTELLGGFISRYSFVVVSLLAFAYTAYFSIARYLGFNAEMLDLGHMSQAIWSITQGQPLVYTYINGPASDLAKHAEFFYYLLAPFYAFLPSPLTLLLLQAGLYAAGAIAVYRLAGRRLERSGHAVLLAAVYLLYPVAITAVLSDLHGDTLAMPLLLFALEALDRRANRTYLLWLLLALSCKVYVAVPVMALGVVLWLQRDRKCAYLTWAAGLSWLALVLLVRTYWLPVDLIMTEGRTASSYLDFYFGSLGAVPQTLPLRVLGALVAFAPALVLGMNALLWMVPGWVVALGVLVSTGPNDVYNYNSHHYALVVPFLMASLVYGAENLRKGSGNRWVKKRYGMRSWEKDIGFSVFLAGLFSFVFVPTPQSPLVMIYQLRDSPFKVTSRDVFTEEWLGKFVPEKASLLADSYLAPHLANRQTLYSNYYTDGPGYLSGKQLQDALAQVDYVVLDAFSVYARLNPETIRSILESPDFHLEKARDGLLLFGRHDGGLDQIAELANMPDAASYRARFGDELGLIDYRVDRVDDRRYRLRFDWSALRHLAGEPNWIAVTRLEGVENSRIVHLPALALLPTGTWPVDRMLREEFVFEVPEDLVPGRYAMRTGWYDLATLRVESGQDSQIGEEFQTGFLEVP